MSFVSLVEQAIPGYLSDVAAMKHFEATDMGNIFIHMVNKYFLKEVALEAGAHSIYNRVFGDVQNQKAALIDEFLREIKNLLQKERQNEALLTFLKAIEDKKVEKKRLLIERLLPNSAFLSVEACHLLACASISLPLETHAQLSAQLEVLTKQLKGISFLFQYVGEAKTLQAEIQRCQIQIKAIESTWQAAYEQSPELANIRTLINKAKRDKIIFSKTLSEAFINKRLSAFKKSLLVINIIDVHNEWDKTLSCIIADYLSDKDDSKLKNKLEAFLSSLIKSHLDKDAKRYVNFINFNTINNTYSLSLAKHLMTTFESKDKVNLENWQKNYKAALLAEGKQSLKQICTQQERKFHKKNDEIITHSLSKLFLQNKTVQDATNFITKLSNTRMFFESVGLTNSSDNNYLAILDVYNYARFAELVEEKRAIFSSLLSPFSSIYSEYKNVSQFEKNNYKKIFRFVMPIIVAVVFTIIIASTLGTLAFAESAFLIALIPTIYLGLCLAAEYVKFKNYLSTQLYTYWHGGEFQVPEFQVNERMHKIFSVSATLDPNKVRAIYIDQIMQCDLLESELAPLADAGMLDKKGLQRRQENLKEKHVLHFEWFDIHSNIELGYDLVHEIIGERLEHIKKVQCKHYDDELESKVFPTLELELNKFSLHEKTFFSGQPTSSDSSQFSPSFFQPENAFEMAKKIKETDSYINTLTV